MFQDVLSFWFNETDPKSWWAVSPAFDDRLRRRFGETLQRARCGELFEWRNTPQGRLAEIIVLDQFSRNIHRGTPQAFAQDPMALVLAQEAIRADTHRILSEAEREFLFLPYMHSESKVVHVIAEALYRQHGSKGGLNFELKHRAIIDRFGRYPHRNAILGRESSVEEVEFLQQPGSSF